MIPMAITTPKTRMVALIRNFGMSQAPVAPAVYAVRTNFFGGNRAFSPAAVLIIGNGLPIAEFERTQKHVRVMLNVRALAKPAYAQGAEFELPRSGAATPPPVDLMLASLNRARLPSGRSSSARPSLWTGRPVFWRSQHFPRPERNSAGSPRPS